MSEIKITKDSLENAILRDGQFVFGNAINGVNNIITSSSSGAFAGGYVCDSEIGAYSFGSFANGCAVNNSSIIANGQGAFANGCADNSSIIANGDGAFACGYAKQPNYILAEGLGAHAEGKSTIASGTASHAEGELTNALHEGAHAEGIGSIASMPASHAGGMGTIANQFAMTAIGQYNSDNTENTLFVVGDGSNYRNRSDAFRVNSLGSNTEITNSVPSSVQAKVNGVSDVYLGCPIGTVVMWAGQMESTAPAGNLPDGWLLCNGSIIFISDDQPYVPDGMSPMHIGGRKFTTDDIGELQTLVNVIGYKWRWSNDINGTLRLPDLQQRFPLGAADGSLGNGYDSSGNLIPAYTSLGTQGGDSSIKLSKQTMPKHAHYLVTCETLYEGNDSAGCAAGNNNQDHNSHWTIPARQLDDDASAYTGNSLSHSNMPPYLAINFIIKYK